MILYHGSKIGGILNLKPAQHNAVNKESVVFAATDRRFALAMIHGTGEQIAVGYHIDQNTHVKSMYIDEIESGTLKLLEAPGILYEVSDEGFRTDPRISHVERICNQSVKVLKEEYIPNVLEELRKFEIQIVEYRDVLKVMEKRGKDPSDPSIEYAQDRFKDVT